MELQGAQKTKIIRTMSEYSHFQISKHFLEDFIYLGERERKRVHMNRGEAEGEERESQGDSALSAEPDQGLDPVTHEISI